MFGTMELVIILFIVLLIFGAGKLPAIGDALGRSIKNFKRSSTGKNELEVAKKSSLDTSDHSVDELSEGNRSFEDAEVVSAQKSKTDRS